MSAVFLVVVVVVVVVGSMSIRRIRPDEADVAWLAGATLSDTGVETDIDRDVDVVCRRYLRRHRSHRATGALFGVAVAAIVGVRWFGSVSIGVGQGSPLADLLFCGLAGVVVGTLSAESYRLGGVSGSHSVASLKARVAPAGRQRVVLARILLGLALFVGVIARFTGHGGVALGTSLLLVVPFVVAEWVRRVISGRERRVMSDRARVLDDRLRSFAASSVSFLLLATGLLSFGWTVSKIVGLTGIVGVVQVVAVLACLIGAVASLRRAAPRRRPAAGRRQRSRVDAFGAVS